MISTPSGRVLTGARPNPLYIFDLESDQHEHSSTARPCGRQAHGRRTHERRRHRDPEKPVRGEVLSVGKGKVAENGDVRPLDVKVGDTVLFGKYSGTEIKVDGEDVLVMREDDIMGVFE